MLKNITEKTVSVTYNSVEVEVNPGQCLEVMIFGLAGPDQIKPVELHIRQRHPNTFETIDNPSAGLNNHEASKRISDLQDKVEHLGKEYAELNSKYSEALEKTKELSADNQGLGKQVKDLKGQISELKAKLKSKDQPDNK